LGNKRAFFLSNILDQQTNNQVILHIFSVIHLLPVWLYKSHLQPLHLPTSQINKHDNELSTHKPVHANILIIELHVNHATLAHLRPPPDPTNNNGSSYTRLPIICNLHLGQTSNVYSGPPSVNFLLVCNCHPG